MSGWHFHGKASGKQFCIVFKGNLWEPASWPLDVLRKIVSKERKKKTGIGKGISLGRAAAVLWGVWGRVRVLPSNLRFESMRRTLESVSHEGDPEDQCRLKVECGLLHGNLAAFGRASRASLRVDWPSRPKCVGHRCVGVSWGPDGGCLDKKEDVGLLWFKTCSQIQYSLWQMVLSSPLLSVGWT